MKKSGVGVAFGIIIGAITGHMGLWLALGVVFGAILEGRNKRKGPNA
jgi:RsiW-degrading membrane proteinase PrsW (M82 family)